MAVVDPQRLIQGTGTPESAWQVWLPSGGIATGALHECLPRSARLVVVAPHPDDDVLACGGLMAMHRAQGGDISVIGVTDGEAGSKRVVEHRSCFTARIDAPLALHRAGRTARLRASSQTATSATKAGISRSLA